MSIAFEAKIDPAQYAALRSLFKTAPEKAGIAASRAVNRALDFAVTRVKRILSAQLGMKQSDLVTPHRAFGARGKMKSAIVKNLATPEKTEAAIVVSSRRIPLAYFRPKQSAMKKQAPVVIPSMIAGEFVVARRRGTGVRYGIGKFKGRIKDGFMAKMKSGHVGVFVRSNKGNKTTSGKDKLIEPRGLSVQEAAKRSPGLSSALSEVSAALNKRIAHEVKNVLRTGK